MEDIIKPKILYVDDEENNLIVFKSSFRRHFDIYVSKSGAEGMKIIQENDIDVIITDQRMPGMTGVEFLKQLPQDLMAIRMVLTGFSDVSAIIEAINSGKVYRYITKPWDKDELKVTIDNAIEALQLKKRNQQLIEELTTANEQLEQKVSERTAELEGALKEINLQKKELEELNVTKNKFFSIVAHDLRNPMSALAGFSAILSEHGDEMSPDQISVFSKDLHKSVKNALTLVENLLSWASSQMKMVKHNPQVVEINALVNELLGQFEMAVAAKQIKLEKDLGPDIVVYADEDHLKLVLRNLLSNAIKFSHKGGEILLSTKCVEEFKAEISISDSGVGMNEDKLAKLFQIGTSHSTRGTEGEYGTGLGLILCKEFIEQNKGEISVASKEGSGTTFTVKLEQCEEKPCFS